MLWVGRVKNNFAVWQNSLLDCKFTQFNQFLIQLQVFWKRETATQVFSFEYCEIFKNNLFIEQLRWLVLGILRLFWTAYNFRRVFINLANMYHWDYLSTVVKGAPESHFTNYFCMVIIFLIRVYVSLHFLTFLLEN